MSIDAGRRARMTAMNQTANHATAANGPWTPTPGASMAEVLTEQATGDPGSVYTDSARYLLGQPTDQEETMNRYEFTTREGFTVGIVEAPTAPAAREIAVSRFGRTDMLCSHLSDGYRPSGIDRAFFDGPQPA